MNHTPGPWKVYPHAPWSIWSAPDIQVACTRWETDDNEFNDTRTEQHEATANAMLIAAAPDLLAALQDILTAWASLTDEPVPDQINIPDLWDDARAAIAKATGQG